MWWNLGYPATAPELFIGLLCLKKVNWKENTLGTIAKRQQIQSLCMLRLWKKNRDLLCKIYHVSYGGISKEFLD